MKIYGILAGVVACLTLTGCPDNPDPKPDPELTPEPAPDGGSGREWVMTARSVWENGEDVGGEVYSYDADGRLISRNDRFENAQYSYSYTANKIVVSGETRCTYNLTNGLVSSGGDESTRYTYDKNNHLVSAEDGDYSVELKWSNNRLVSMTVYDIENNEYALAIKFKYRNANGIHPDCCRVFNSYFMAMMPSEIDPMLVQAGYFGVVPTDVVIEGFEPMFDVGNPEEVTCDVYYRDSYGNGRPTDVEFRWLDDSVSIYSYMWGKI